MALTKITPQMFDTSATAHDLNVDNGTFVVDGSASRVGIGTTTPSTLLDVNGVLTAGSIAVDNITIDGNEIDVSSGHIVLDSADEIKLDSHSGIIRVQTQGGDIGMIRALNNDLQIRSMVSDKDIVFYGNDGGSGFTALTLDMSAVGAATFAGPVLAPAGSASIPSLSFSGDPNTGLYSVAADNIGFAVAGSARAFMSATQFNMTGNVVASGNIVIGDNAYIGTTSSTTAMQIAAAGGVTFASSVKLSGQTSSDGLRLDLAGSTDYKIGETSTNDIVAFGAAGGAATHLIHHNISSGKVGIGIANPATTLNISSGSADLLTIQNNTYQSSGQNTEAILRFKAGSGTDDERAKGGILLKNDGSAYGRGDLHFLVDSNNDNGNAVLADSKMVIRHEGMVGIGTTNPFANLEVRGAAANGQIYIGGSTTNTYGKIYSDNDGVLVLAADGGNNAANSYLALEIDNVARVAANTTGTVFGDVSVLADGMTATPNDINQAELGPGYIRLKRDDTANAQQITFDKNGSTHSYFETATSGLIYVVNSGMDHRFNANVRIMDASLEFDKPSVYGFRFLHNDAGNDLSIQQGDANNANYVSRFTIDSVGNVGIGTNNPSTNYTKQLHVHGSGTGASVHITDNNSGSGNGDGFELICHNSIAYVWNRENTDIKFGTNATDRMSITSTGLMPYATNTYDLGSSTVRWRNIFSQDLHLSNEDTGGNDVDGTEGNWTIQEGEEHLYIINNKTGKKFRFALEEIT